MEDEGIQMSQLFGGNSVKDLFESNGQIKSEDQTRCALCKVATQLRLGVVRYSIRECIGFSVCLMECFN